MIVEPTAEVDRGRHLGFPRFNGLEVLEYLPDGTEFKAVWSHLRQSGVAKLVTVHFFDRG